MKQYTLTRTGDRPLTFTGEVVASAGGKMHGGQNQNRYHEITVYRTTGGKYVLEVEYCTCWSGEDGRHYAEVCNSPDAIVDALRFCDPLEHLQGFPAHPAYADKQARLEESLRQRWGVLVSEVLGELPGAEERVE